METSDALRNWVQGEVEAGGEMPGPFVVTKAVTVYEVEDVDGARYIGSMWENFAQWDSGLLRSVLYEIEGYDAND